MRTRRSGRTLLDSLEELLAELLAGQWGSDRRDGLDGNVELLLVLLRLFVSRDRGISHRNISGSVFGRLLVLLGLFGGWL